MNSLTFRSTRVAAYIGYVTQAVVNNLPPLLFVTFWRQFDISLDKLASLIVINFMTQLAVDLLSVRYMDKIGYRRAAIAAHIFAAVGLFSLGVLPFALPNAYAGILIAMILNAIGGGIAEVIISPIVEALPGEQKAASMAMLHSFYCWGHLAVVLLSTLFFVTAGIGNWRILPMLWAIVPLCNLFLFAKVPLKTLVENATETMPLKTLFSRKFFFVLLLMMLCAGASEQAMAQWASFFAETGLGVSKTTGDILGPCAFALCMGLSRIVYSTQSAKGKITTEGMLLFSGLFCVVCYLTAIFASLPILALTGCALCGLAVGAMWPGVFSITSRLFPTGGTPMFAFLALAGDLGCGGGPFIVGLIMNRSAFSTGLLAAVIFPVSLALGIVVLLQNGRKTGHSSTS